MVRSGIMVSLIINRIQLVFVTFGPANRKRGCRANRKNGFLAFQGVDAFFGFVVILIHLGTRINTDFKDAVQEVNITICVVIQSVKIHENPCPNLKFCPFQDFFYLLLFWIAWTPQRHPCNSLLKASLFGFRRFASSSTASTIASRRSPGIKSSRSEII